MDNYLECLLLSKTVSKLPGQSTSNSTTQAVRHMPEEKTIVNSYSAVMLNAKVI